MQSKKGNKKWVAILLGIFGVSLLSAGVFAATTITLNSGNAVNLGAGAAAVNVCDSSATISTQQTYNSTNQRYELTTISISDVDASASACSGKTLSMAFVANSTTYSTTWSLVSGTTTYTWGGSGSGTGYAVSTFAPIGTASSGISTFAVAAY